MHNPSKQQKLFSGLRALMQKLQGKQRNKPQDLIHTNTNQNGWGARIRTQEWRDQNPLPYRLATPHQIQLKCQKLERRSPKALLKHTITKLIPVVVLSFSLCSSLRAEPGIKVNTNYHQEEKLITNNQGGAIEVARFYRNGVIYSSQERLYFNNEQINFINAQDESIKNIVIKGNDFFLASITGVYHNYRKIFAKGPCYHIAFGKKSINVSCQGGIYQASYDAKLPVQNYDWRLLELSPPDTYFFTLNRSGTNIEYAVAENGFYHYDSRKQRWFKYNHQLKRDFNDSYGLGRFYVTSLDVEGKSLELIVLASSSGILVSDNAGAVWHNISSGLQANPDGFFSVREIKAYEDILLAATSTGIYQAQLTSNYTTITWHKLSLKNSSLDENHNENFYSLDTNSDGEIIASNSQAEIIKFQLNSTPLVIRDTAVSLEASEQIISKEDNNIILTILKAEPEVQKLHKAALDFSGIPTGKNFRTYSRRARLRNFLPAFEAGASKDHDNILSIETRGQDDFNSSTSSISTSFDKNSLNRNDRQINTGVKLSWEFGNLLYDPEVNDLITSARLTANIRENLLTELTQIYYERKELLYDFLQGVFSQQDLIQADSFKQILKINEYTAQLDARSGAWFSAALKDSFKQIPQDLPETVMEQLKEIFHAT